MNLTQRSATIAVAVLVLAGCGGSTSSPGTAGPTSGTVPTDASGGQPTAAGQTSGTPTSGPSIGGGAVGGVCDLVTADEMTQVMGVPVTLEVVVGPPDTCVLNSGGENVAAFVYTPTGMKIIFDSLAADPEARVVSGVGDKAVIPPNTPLLVLKGDSMISVTITDDGRPAAELEELAKQIGIKAAARM